MECYFWYNLCKKWNDLPNNYIKICNKILERNAQCFNEEKVIKTNLVKINEDIKNYLFVSYKSSADYIIAQLKSVKMPLVFIIFSSHGRIYYKNFGHCYVGIVEKVGQKNNKGIQLTNLNNILINFLISFF
jgi:flavorubredoxin